MERRRFSQSLLFGNAVLVRGARADRANGVAVARNGNPSQSGLKWPVYSTSQRARTLFDTAKSEPIDDPCREERLMLRDWPSRGLL
jgi:carboxylesterase type B